MTKLSSPVLTAPGRPNGRASKVGLATATAGTLLFVALFVTSVRFGVRADVELKIFGIALAVGLDVLALSIAVGVMHVGWSPRLRLGVAFSAAEVLMQVVGYFIGTGAGRMVGALAIYIGFAVLAAVGVFIVRDSDEPDDKSTLKVDTGWGLLAVCASISLDSLGIGVSLPGVPLPLLPLLATVAVSTVVFTTIGLAFGAQLGGRYKRVAERTAGIVLIALAIFFTVQHLAGWAS